MKEYRLKNLISNMERHGLEHMLISSPASIFYLTGKWIETGERLLALYINNSGKNRLLINELFPIDTNLGVDLEVYNDNQDPITILAGTIDNKKLGIDKNWPSNFLIRLMERKQGMSFINGSPIIDEIRMIKDEEEINLMKEASRVNDNAMSDIVNIINADIDEKKVGKLLSEIYEKYNTESFSFQPLIAYGANCAEPHHASNLTKPKDGNSIIIDIGGKTKMYCSDMTRTVFYKRINEEQKKVYDLVLSANLKAIATVKPNARFSDIDLAARAVIEDGGYGEYFTHRSGHNIGIEVHEFPDVSSTNNMIVRKGMIFSIEPGIYLPNNFGVRIEDLVVVTDTGCDVLNTYTKRIQVI